MTNSNKQLCLMLQQILNKNKSTKTGAARADIRPQALRFNKKRERDFSVTWEHNDQRIILNRDYSCSSAA